MSEIYVVGHKNPDTDTVVSAMAYAALKHALGEQDYTAARLDHLSDETKRMLARFGFETPVRLRDVRTQVKDLDFDTPPALHSSVTLDKAWHTMSEEKISVIPVINDDGTLYGTLSSGDIASYNMETIQNPRIDDVPLFNLISVLEGRIVNE